MRSYAIFSKYSQLILLGFKRKKNVKVKKCSTLKFFSVRESSSKFPLKIKDMKTI